ncbi:hypothetical protein ACJ41O_006187 [Fusarium nematophilum]
MRVSTFLPTLGGLVALAQASPHLLGGFGDSLTSKESRITPSTCSLAQNWEDRTLFKGVASPETGTLPAISLGLHLPKAQISGDVKLELVKEFLQEPKVRVSLAGIKAFIQLDISASAAVHEAVELFASPKLELEIPGLLEAEAGAAIALDLVVGVDAAIDLSTGVYVSFGEDAFVDISLLTKDIVDVSLDGLVAKALPLGVGAEVDLSAEVALQLGLRLRTEIDLGAELEIPSLEIEAGAKVAIWVSLFDYTAVIIGSDDCVVSVSEAVALTLGLALELNVEIGDILDLSLAPTITITLATAAEAKICQPDRGSVGLFLNGFEEADSSAISTAAVSATSAADPATTFNAFAATPTEGHGNSSALRPTGDVTSTVSSTHIYTITSCAASVVNCPASYTQKVITSTIVSSTYVCPASEATLSFWTSASHSTTEPVSVTTVTDTFTTIVPCSERTTSTFHPPTNSPPPAPTVTIVDRTTVCPGTEKTHQSTEANQVPSSSLVAATTAPTVETPHVPSSVAASSENTVSGAPTSNQPIPIPTETAPFPANNGTIPDKTIPGAPVPTGYVTTPIVSSTPSTILIASSTPSTIPAPPTNPAVNGAEVIRGSLMGVLPVILCLFI